ncbi:hypothetical protein IWZ01DRAFT_483362 [Phyllosticta capitalensis]
MESSKLRHGADTDPVVSEEDSPLLWENDPSLFRLKTLDCLPADTDCQTETNDGPEGQEPIHSADTESILRNNISVSDVTDISTIQTLRRYSGGSTCFSKCAASSFTVSVESCGEILLKDQDSGGLRSQKSPPDDFEAERHDQHKRRPLRIEQPIFFLWIGFFVFVMIGLEILRYFSAKNNGIATVPHDYYYLWRFGPSFFLGIMAAFWGQEEYRIKQMTPWMELKNGESKLGKSLELNYITTSTIEAFSASFRMKHFSVTCAITVSLLFRVLAIVSTGLLSLDYPHIVRDSTIVLLDRFDLNKSNGIPSTRAVSRYWAIHHFNTPYTAGTTSKFATQSFAPGNEASDSTVSFPADTFAATLKDCGPVHWQYSGSYKSPANCSLPFYGASLDLKTVNVDTSYCHLKDIQFGVVCEEPESEEGVFTVQCHQKEATENKAHLLIFRTIMPPGQTTNQWNLTGILCKPEYYYTQRWISSNRDTSGVHQATEELSFDDLDRIPKELADKITTEMFILEEQNYSDTLTELANMTATEDIFKNMNDISLLTDVFIRTFQDFAPQWVKATRTFPQNITVHGSISEKAPRLYAQNLSVNLMEALLAVMIISVITISSFPKLLPTERPATLALHALKMSLGHVLEEGIPPGGPNRSPVWQPAATRSPFRTASLIIPPLLITAIETLLQCSTRANGIAYVSPESYMKYIWVFAPSITMAIVGLLFYLLSNGAKQIDQFQDLYYNQPGFDATLRDPLGTQTIPLIVKSSKNKRLSLAIILVASLAASLLTTITSGLYDAVPLSVNQDVPLELQDWYQNLQDVPAYQLPRTDRGISVTDLIAFENISYPQWTHEEFAFPKFTVSDRHGTRNPSSGLQLRAQIPAVRAQMNCTLDSFLASLDTRQHKTDDLNMTLAYLPVTCGLGNEFLGGEWNRLGFDDNTMDDSNPNRFFATSASTSYGPFGKTIFAVGRLTKSRIEDTSVICCQPYNEILFVDVTLAVPEYVVDASEPPRPHEESSKYLCPYGGSFFTFIDLPMSEYFGDSINGTTDFDGFFGKLIYGRDGTPFDEIFGLKNGPPLVERMNRQFQILAAQLNHEHFAPLEANYTKLPEYPFLTNLSGNMTSSRFRLQQSPISSRILEGLLAFMVVCAGISFLLGGGTKVLREDPGSIGAKMRLFVGSEMIKRFPEGAGDWDEKDLLKSGIFEGAVFRLGWWVGGEYVGGEGSRGEGEGEEDGSEGLKRGRFGIDVVDKKLE